MTRTYTYICALLLALGVVGAGQSWAAELANDNFNRANGVLGANWTTVTGATAPAIVDEHVQPSVAGGSNGSMALYTGIAWPQDQYGTIRVVHGSDNSKQSHVILRGTTATRTNYECVVRSKLGSTAVALMYKVTAGTSVLLGTTVAGTPTLNPYDVLRCSAAGSSPTVIKLYINNVELLSHSDSSSPFTSGSVGILSYTLSGSTASSQLDEFTGGSGTGAGTGFGSEGGGAGGGCTMTASTATAAVVNMIVHDATAGDVLCLPTVTVTWKSPDILITAVVINKAITLRGTTSCTGTPVTCVDGTIINDGTLASGGTEMMSIAATGVRVTGISLKDPRAISDPNPMVTLNCVSCRFDHNSLTHSNAVLPPRGVIAYSVPASTSLIDHNYFKDLIIAVDIRGSNVLDNVWPGDFSWRSPLVPGDGSGVYVEDNHVDDTADANSDAFDSSAGARYVFRYNTVKNTNSGNHGLDGGGSNRSTMATELYRNTYTNVGSVIYTPWNTRGGWHAVWQNVISATAGSYTSYMWIQNYRSDTVACAVCFLPRCDGTYVADQNTGGQEGYACRDQVGRGPETDYANDWPVKTVSPAFSEPLFPAYSLGNLFKGAAPTIAQVVLATGDGSPTRLQTYHIINNRDFYMEVPAFNGTAGTGTGTLAARPATCTIGVAYLATDQGSWNTSGNGDGSGLLYKCTATNTWTLFYTPYAYPHPLQTSANPPAPDPLAAGTHMAAFAGATFAIVIWPASIDVNHKSYRVYRCTTSGTCANLVATITPASAAASNSPDTRYIDATRYIAQQECYSIKDVNINDYESVATTPACITVTGRP